MKKMVTITADEYQQLKMNDDLIHKQRFTIRSLEKQLDRQIRRSAAFSNKTLDILLHHGYSMKEILLLYGGKQNA